MISKGSFQKSSDETPNLSAKAAPNIGAINEPERLFKLMNNAKMVPSTFLGMIRACITNVGMIRRA